jgi:hypothetical protein
MIAQNNVTHLFILSDAHFVTTAAPTVVRTAGVLRAGEAACDYSALVAGDRFKVLYYNAASKLVISPLFATNDIISPISKVAPTTAVSQVSTVGYNGTDGDIVETNYGKYLVAVGLRDTLKLIGGKRLYKFGDYTASATCHKYDVAIGLADSLYANLNQDAFLRVVPKAICSSAYAAGNTFTHDATVVQYSQYVTVATNSQYATSTELAVGDYVRLGAATTPTVNDPVYRVLELTSGTIFKVDRPVTNASGSYTHSGTVMTEVIPKATAEASTVKWGLKLTGNDDAQPFEVGKYGNNVILFSLGASVDFGTTEIRLATSPVWGRGNYHDVAQLDWELQGNRREAYRIAEYPVSFTSNAVSTDTYTYIYTIKFREKSTDSIEGPVQSLVTLMFVAKGTNAVSDIDAMFVSYA